MLHRIVLRGWIVGLAAALAGCEEPGPTAPPDRSPPVLSIVFPIAGAHDRDGDGLVDVEVEFSDPQSGVDLETLSLTSERSLLGSGVPHGANLLEVWRVERADSLGLVVEETRAHPMARGFNRLIVSVQDREGNDAIGSVTLDLPGIALHATIPTGHLGNTAVLLADPAASRMYLLAHDVESTELDVLELDALELRHGGRTAGGRPAHAILSPGGGRLVAGLIDRPELAVFDLATASLVGSPPTATFWVGGMGADPARGVIHALATHDPRPEPGVFGIEHDPFSGVLLRTVEYSSVPMAEDLSIQWAAFAPSTGLLYALTGTSGLVVLDPAGGRVTSSIDLEPDDVDERGGGFHLSIFLDRLLVSRGLRLGMARVPLADPLAVEVSPLGGWAVMRVETVPDGGEIVVAACCRSHGPTHHNAVLLLDPLATTILETLELPLDGVEKAYFRAMAISADGRAVMAAQMVRGDGPEHIRLLVFLRR